MTTDRPTVTVTAPNGDRWTVAYLPSMQRKRTGLGNGSGADAARYVRGILATYADASGLVRCAACGARCAVGRGTVVDGYAVAAIEADRAVADLDGWTVQGAGVPYGPATVLPVCPLHNGDQTARAALDATARERLDVAARAALDAHARRA